MVFLITTSKYAPATVRQPSLDRLYHFKKLTRKSPILAKPVGGSCPTTYILDGVRMQLSIHLREYLHEFWDFRLGKTANFLFSLLEKARFQIR